MRLLLLVRSEGSIPVASMIDSQDCDGSIRVIDAAEHAVRSASSTVDSGELIAETTSNPVRTVDECAGDELNHSGADCFG